MLFNNNDGDNDNDNKTKLDRVVLCAVCEVPLCNYNSNILKKFLNICFNKVGCDYVCWSLLILVSCHLALFLKQKENIFL